jgi:hypothetical protein
MDQEYDKKRRRALLGRTAEGRLSLHVLERRQNREGGKSFMALALGVPVTNVHCPSTKVTNIIF